MGEELLIDDACGLLGKRAVEGDYVSLFCRCEQVCDLIGAVLGLSPCAYDYVHAEG